MPITLLHFGVMAPIHRWVRWPALISFTLVQLWLDGAAISAWSNNQPLPSHDSAWHTMHGALLFACFIALWGLPYFSWRWAAGAFYGAVTHIYLDGWVHPEMHPFQDTEPGVNTIYLGSHAMPWVSAVLVPFAVWLVALVVRDASNAVRELLTQGRKSPKT